MRYWSKKGYIEQVIKPAHGDLLDDYECEALYDDLEKAGIVGFGDPNNLIPDRLLELVPKLGEQSQMLNGDYEYYAVYEIISSDWKYYLMEYDLDEDKAYGLIAGYEAKFDYFSLSELKSKNAERIVDFDLPNYFKNIKSELAEQLTKYDMQKLFPRERLHTSDHSNLFSNKEDYIEARIEPTLGDFKYDYDTSAIFDELYEAGLIRNDGEGFREVLSTTEHEDDTLYNIYQRNFLGNDFGNSHVLMPKALLERVPKLNKQYDIYDKVCYAAYTVPTSKWTYFLTEYDPEKDKAFGLLSRYPAWGYFSLSELEGLGAERLLKIDFPMHLSEMKDTLLEHFTQGEVDSFFPFEFASKEKNPATDDLSL